MQAPIIVIQRYAELKRDYCVVFAIFTEELEGWRSWLDTCGRVELKNSVCGAFNKKFQHKNYSNVQMLSKIQRKLPRCVRFRLPAVLVCRWKVQFANGHRLVATLGCQFCECEQLSCKNINNFYEYNYENEQYSYDFSGLYLATKLRSKARLDLRSQGGHVGDRLGQGAATCIIIALARSAVALPQLS